MKTSFLIMAAFVVLWLIRYPREFWKTLTFQYRGDLTDALATLASWVFLGGFCIIVTVLLFQL